MLSSLTFLYFDIDSFGMNTWLFRNNSDLVIILKREAHQKIMQINNTFRVLLVSGPRQVGKTTLLTEYMPDGIHPNEKGHELIANKIKEYLED